MSHNEVANNIESVCERDIFPSSIYAYGNILFRMLSFHFSISLLLLSGSHLFVFFLCFFVDPLMCVFCVSIKNEK